ncbi:LVIVD repeat-containing protein [Natrarchaeobius sp. A-rgal3]|uniref:LVIVD repeat-containing protein n=1 Tax=Natrarchaeobius versutus TaxID=1679078 RepID=UPI003510CEB4
MRRRSFLRTGGVASVALTIPTSSAVAGRSRVSGASTQESYEPLGRVSVEGAAEAVLGDDGSVAYLAATTGFAVVDVSDPEAPELLAEDRAIDADGSPLLQILDVKADDEMLVVPGPANPDSDEFFHGFVRYDVSDPADPVEIGQPYETGFHIHNCYLDGEVLYVVANDVDENPLVVYDLGGEEAEEIGRWSLLEHEPGWRDVDWQARYLHDVYVHDAIAYLAHWNAGTYLLDVSDPAEPEYVSHVAETDLESQLEVEDDRDARLGLPGNDHYAAVDETGDLLAVGREAWSTGGDDPDGPGGIDLYDVSDSEEPRFRASIDAPRAADERYYGPLWTTAHNFELRDGDLYASWYQGGVTIHDVSDPAEPTERASWRDPETAGFWTARVAEPGQTFVASSTPAIPHGLTDGALYTFPIRSGEQADQPSLTDLDALEFDGDPDAGENESSNGGGSDDTGAATNSSDGSTVASDDAEDDDASGGADRTPGFTATGAVGAAGGLAALEWFRRYTREDDRGPS